MKTALLPPKATRQKAAKAERRAVLGTQAAADPGLEIRHTGEGTKAPIPVIDPAAAARAMAQAMVGFGLSSQIKGQDHA